MINKDKNVRSELAKLNDFKWECIRRNKHYKEFWEDLQKDPKKYETLVYEPPIGENESEYEWRKRVKGGKQYYPLQRKYKEFGIVFAMNPEFYRGNMPEGRIFINPCILAGDDSIIFQIPTETINKRLGTKHADNIIVLAINVLKKQKHIEYEVKRYVKSGIMSLGFVAKSDFNDKELLKELLREGVVINSEYHSNYVYFDKSIKNEIILEKRLKKIDVSEIEIIKSIWQKSGLCKIEPLRIHIDKISVYIKIWDLKEEGKKNEEIAQIVFKSEWDNMQTIRNHEYEDDAIDKADKLKDALIKKVQEECQRADELINGGYRDLR